MDGFNEKKWFIYLGDHHEGPFSLSEIQVRMGQSEVTASNYVWAEGMPDWKVMTEVPEFEVLLHLAGPKPPLPEQAGPVVLTAVPSAPETPTITSVEIETPAASAGDAPPVQKEIRARAAPRKAPKSRSMLRSFVIAFFAALLVLIALRFGAASNPGLQAFNQTLSDAVQPALLALTRKAPALSKWISPIPALKDVDPADYEELRQAAAARLETDGARIAFALANADPASPTFYVSGNLPDGAVIEVVVEGVGDTLLNQLGALERTRAVLAQKLGQTGPVRFKGQALPRGQYTVYAIEAEQGQPPEAQAALTALPPVSAQVPAALPKGIKLLVSKSYFLGGPKDAAYENRLKEYHAKLQEKAQTELAEVKQFASTLEAQFGHTAQNFKQLSAKKVKGKVGPQGRKGWNSFHATWSKLQAQLQASWEKWPTEPGQPGDEVFYGALYRTVRSFGESVNKLHELQHSLMGGQADARAAEIQLPTLLSECETALAAMKAKIDQAEKLTPTANGMPRREGL